MVGLTAAELGALSRLVVHRALKPSNVLVSADGQVYLPDFGIAKRLNDAAIADTAPTQQQGRVLTPHHASPVQLRGEPVTVASDVSSLNANASAWRATPPAQPRCGRWPGRALCELGRMDEGLPLTETWTRPLAQRRESRRRQDYWGADAAAVAAGAASGTGAVAGADAAGAVAAAAEAASATCVALAAASAAATAARCSGWVQASTMR